MSYKILIFSDLHYGISSKNKSGKDGINTFGNIKADLSKLKNEIIKLKPDIVFNIGDVLYSNTEVEAISFYKEFLSIFSGINIYHVYGNHDLKFIELNELIKLTNQESRVSFIHKGYKHIIIDAYRNGDIIVSKDTLSWLQKELSDTSIKSMIYCHYPITEDEGNLSYYHRDSPDACFVKNSNELKELINNSNCDCFINGHTHFFYENKIDNISHITIPSFSENVDGEPSRNYVIMDIPSLKIEVKRI